MVLKNTVHLLFRRVLTHDQAQAGPLPSEQSSDLFFPTLRHAKRHINKHGKQENVYVVRGRYIDDHIASYTWERSCWRPINRCNYFGNVSIGGHSLQCIRCGGCSATCIR